MPRETINEVNINKYFLQLDDNLSSRKCNTMQKVDLFQHAGYNSL